MMDLKDVTELQHEEFYRYISQAHDKPRYTLHYKTDAPLNIRSIFYVPETVRAQLGSAQECWAAKPLHCPGAGHPVATVVSTMVTTLCPTIDWQNWSRRKAEASALEGRGRVFSLPWVVHRRGHFT
jgi:hypothetical protein